MDIKTIIWAVEDKKKAFSLLDFNQQNRQLRLLQELLESEGSEFAAYISNKYFKANVDDEWHQEMEKKLISSLVCPLEHLEIAFKDHRRGLVEQSLLSGFKCFLSRFTELEKILNDPQNLRMGDIEVRVFDGTLKRSVYRQIKDALNAYEENKDSIRLNKLKEIITVHLNQIGGQNSYEIIKMALLVIGFEEASSEDQQKKKLIDAARKIINHQMKYLNEEGLKWIGKNLDHMVKLSKETKKICKKLCHKVLQDFDITTIEKDLLIKFVSFGLTMSISNKGDVIFEDKQYSIKNKNAELLLEEIAKAVIDQERDLLSIQYKQHKPIFPKKHTSAGMKQAAADIEMVSSVVDRSYELTNNAWLLTKLVDGNKEIMLLEQRSAIGDQIVYQVDVKNLIRINPQKPYRGSEILFGTYIPGKRYQGTSYSLTISQGNQIMSEQKLPDLSKFTKEATREYFQEELLGLGNKDRLNYIQSELDNKLSDYQKTLASKLKDKKLTPENEEKIKGYHSAFIRTFAIAYTAAQVIESGQVQLDTGDMKITMLSTLVSFAPFAGDALSSVVRSAGEFFKEREIKRNARKMLDIAADAVGLNQVIGEVAYKVAMNDQKQEEIVKIQEESIQNLTGSLFEKMKKFCEILGEKYDEMMYTKMYKSAAEKLGNNDANKLIEEWVANKIDATNIQKGFINLLTKGSGGHNAAVNEKDLTSGEPGTRKSNCCQMF